MNDTIAAVASGITASGIGIIRISGPEAFSVLAGVFRPGKKADVLHYPAGTIHYGHIVEGDPGDPSSPVVDECLVMILRGPKTYTTEDTAEINCHGGPFVMRRVLDIVLRAGARLAEPGEFTKRAFLGGRIDLTEAEAVMDLISARSGDALRSSLLQLSGSVKREITELRSVLLDEMSYIEAALDDPEHDDLDGYGDTLLERLGALQRRLTALRDSYREGRYLKEGILTVIVGKPNAGKSSLLNALSGEDRAIVTEIEGTTRDVLEEQVRVGGILLRILDTAGIREARDRIEQIGVERARQYAQDADLLLAVFDSSRAFDDNDLEILNMIRGRRSIILLNKSDLPPKLFPEDLTRMADGIPVIALSARELTGMSDLEQTIRSLFFREGASWNEELCLTNARHTEAVTASLQSVSEVIGSIRAGMTEDLYLVDLMDAYAKLGEIIGEEVGDDLVDNIFAKFCMGK